MAGIAIVGCGYVADKYMASLPQHSKLKLMGAFDRDHARATTFSDYHGVPQYESLAKLLEDERVSIVLNLTNPRSHFDVSEACLRSGKHVYSEKPLAMDFAQAKRLVSLAASRGLWISSAPCSLLGETAQTIWRALREKRVGDVRLAYAEIDEGLVHLMPYGKWVSDSGAPWPYKDEFEVGCTLEHAGYALTWLLAFFGPVRSMTAWASIQVDEKTPGIPLNAASADFSVACMQFESGVSARLTCSILAPHNRQLQIFGDRGVLSTSDTWKYRSPVSIRRLMHFRRRQFYSPWRQRYPLQGKDNPSILVKGGIQMDWCRGVTDLDDAIRENRKPRLAPDFCLHVTEVSLAIHNAVRQSGAVAITTRFDPVDPMPWAK